MRRLTPAVLLLGIAVGLVACGKKGPPDPPGPADQITYPRGYPVPPPGPPPAVSPPAQWPFGITRSPE